MRYKILYVDKSSEIGGAETSLLLHLRHLDRNRYIPIVVLPAEGTLSEQLRALRVQFIITPLNTIKLKGLNPLPYLCTVGRLVGIIKRGRVDLVHANDFTTNQYGVVAARVTGVPIICHLRNLCSKSSVERSLLPWSDHLIANSFATAQSYLACRDTPEKVTVIYNGVDLSDYSPDDNGATTLRKRFNVADDSFLIGIVGRILPDKGHHVLVRALAEVNKKHKNIYLAVIGPADSSNHSGYQRDERFLTEIRQLIAAFGLNRYVYFWGEQRDIGLVYQALDLVVLPTFEEGFGRVLIEAMAAEKPVISSGVGGTPEIIEANVTGFLVPPGNPQRLAAAILALACDRELARNMGLEGRKRVERLFTIEKNMAKTEMLYQNVLGQNSLDV